MRPLLSKRSRVRQRLVVVSSLVVGAVVGIVVAIHSPRFAQSVQHEIEALAREELGLDVSIGTLHVSLIMPGVSLENIEVRSVAHPDSAMSARRAQISLQPWPSVTGAIVIESLIVDGLRINADLDELADDLHAPTGRGGSQPKVDIQRLALWNTALDVRSAGRHLHIDQLDLDWSPAPVGGRRVHLGVSGGAFVQGPVAVQFETTLRGMFRGSLDRPGVLTLDHLVVSLPRTQLWATGAVDLAGTPRLAVHVEASTKLETLAHMFALGLPIAGTFSTQAELRGPLDTLAVQGHVRADSLRYADAGIGSVAADGTFLNDAAQIDAFEVSNPRAGTVAGRATIELSGPTPITAWLHLRDVSLPAVLELAGVPNAWVRLWADGDALVKLRLLPDWLFDIHFDGLASRFAVLDRSFHDPAAESFLSVAPVQIAGDFLFTREDATFRQVGLKCQSSALTVDGMMRFDAQNTYDLRVASDHLDMSDLGPIAWIPFQGVGKMGVNIEGPLRAPSISGATELQDFAVYEVRLGDVTSTLVYHDLALRLERTTFRHGHGRAEGKAVFDFAANPPQMRADVDVHEMEATALLASAGIQVPATGLAALFSGSLHSTGPMTNPVGDGELQASVATIGKMRLGPVRLQASWGQGAEWASVDAFLQAGSGTFSGHLGVTHVPITLNIELAAKSVPLTLVQMVEPELDLGGTVDGSVSLHGPAKALDGEAKAHVEDLRVMGASLSSGAVSATVKAGKAKIEATLADNRLRISSDLQLKAGLPFALELRLDQAALASWLRVAPGLNVVFSGEAEAYGLALEPESIAAKASLEYAHLSWNDLVVDLGEPIEMEFERGQFAATPVALHGTNLTASIRDVAMQAGRLTGLLEAHGDLIALRQLWANRLDSARGPFDIAVKVDGPINAPSFSGEAAVRGGVLRLRDGSQQFENIDAHLVFADRKVIVESGGANVGGGSARLSGNIELPPHGPPQLDLHADLKNISVRPGNEISATGSGSLVLVGPLDDLLLKGGLDLSSVRYTANLDLEHLIPKREHALTALSSVTPGESLRLGVRVRAPKNIIVTSNVLEAELKADLLVTGTSERIGLVGSVNPVWARAHYRDNVFEVQRAEIDFSDEFRIFAQFDVRAVTKACGMDIVVEVQGTSDQYTASPQGRDETGAVDPQDALLCLQFGLRLRDFTGHNAAGMSDTLPGGLDALWTVSGLDDKVRQMLPIKVDELRLTSGWSPRTMRTTPRVVVAKKVGADLQLKYARSLNETNDQDFTVDYRLSANASFQGSWTNATEVPVGDFGLDLRLHWDFR